MGARPPLHHDNRRRQKAGRDVERIHATSTLREMGQLLPRAARLPFFKMRLPTRYSEVATVSLPPCLICFGCNTKFNSSRLFQLLLAFSLKANLVSLILASA